MQLKGAENEDVEEAVNQWFRQARSLNIPITGTLVQDHAKQREQLEQLGKPEFRCSNGWLTRFKQRKGIDFQQISGEAKSVDPAKVDALRSTLLSDILAKYSPNAIYNTDEIGLFRKLRRAWSTMEEMVMMASAARSASPS